MILHFSGQITEQDTDTLRASVEQNGNVVALDLGDILIVDRESIKLLALCQCNGLELRNCPAYIREWITRERVQSGPDGSQHASRAREDIEHV